MIDGDDLLPELVSQRLGVEPFAAVRRGECVSQRSSKRSATGFWVFKVEAKPPVLPSALARELLAHFPADAEFWSELRRDYGVNIEFRFYVSTSTGCFELEPDVARALATTGATLVFDLLEYERPGD